MSTFRVAVETIDSISCHPQADRLEIASLRGMTFQFVVAKGSFLPGDAVIYFPLDATLPARVLDALGLTGKLGGEHRNVVGTARLRGFISQGIVAAPADFIAAGLLRPAEYHHGVDLTAALGVEKYVKPEVVVPGAILTDLPAVLSVFDIEGADRFAAIASRLMDIPVRVTESSKAAIMGYI